ncbi:MAG: hypothetical protein ACTSWP_02925 [Candidatus Freyarchaeota archaeon]
MELAKSRKFFVALLMAAMLIPLILVFAPASPSQPMVPLYSPSGEEQAVAAKQFNPPWWNYTFRYRRQVNFTDTSGVNHVEQPVDIYLTFTNGECYNNSIRVRYWTGNTWITIPYQIWNETFYSGTSYYKSLTITFYVNVSASTTQTGYYLYYNDSDSGVELYTNQVWYSPPSATDNIHYVFESNIYRVNTSILARGGKIEDSYNKISGTYWTNSTITIPPDGTNGFHWNPDANYSTGTTSKYGPVGNPQILEEGPIFITYTTLAKLGDLDGFCRITYRFFKWGWICETNSTANTAMHVVYRNNEWVFNPSIMQNLTYKLEGQSPQTKTFAYGTNDEQKLYDYSSPLWFTLWDQNDGEAIGTFDIVNPSMQDVSKSPTTRSYTWYYRIYWRDARNYYEFWDRYWDYLDFSANGWVYEKFAVYIWNGSKGYSGVLEFGQFAEAMKNPPTITVGDPEDHALTIVVKDAFGTTVIPGVKVEIYDDSGFTQLVTSGTTDSNGVCVFNLPEKSQPYYIRANITVSYKSGGYVNDSNIWTPGVNSSQVTIIFSNVTRLYIEVKDANGNPVQNIPTYETNVTVNYTSLNGAENITEVPVDEYYGNVTLYVWSNEEVNITVKTKDYPDGANITKIWDDDAQAYITQPFTMNKARSVKVYLNYSLSTSPTHLECDNGTLFETYWDEDAAVFVWLRVGSSSPGGAGVEANWVKYNITDSDGNLISSGTMVNDTSAKGLYNMTIKPYDIGMVGGQRYTITFFAEPADPLSYSNPVPIIVYLDVKKVPLEILCSASITAVWNETPTFTVTVQVNNTRTGSPLAGLPVKYTIYPSDFVGYSMNDDGNGNYTIPTDILSQLIVGYYTVTVWVDSENHTADVKAISLNIQAVPTAIVYNVSVKVYWGENVTLVVSFTKQGGSSISNATVTWAIPGTEITGAFTEDPSNPGTYIASINSTLFTPGSYIVSVTAWKPNYKALTEPISVTVEEVPVTPTQTVLLFNPEATIIGNYIMVENNIPVVPLVISIKDYQGKPLTGAEVKLNGIPLQEVSPGIYTISIPVYGISESTIPLMLTVSKANYSTTTTPITLTIKEKSVAVGPLRIPFTFFVVLVLALTVPAAGFASYVYIQRARIPPIIRRIDQLIERISKGLPVEVEKPLTRDAVVERLLREELAVVGVEPRAVRYVPPEVADRLVPLLVEIGKSESEAHAILAELRASTPAEREKLLETIGVPPDISATILQELEKEEEERLLKEKVEEKEEEKEEGSEAGREAEEKPEGGSEEEQDREADEQ